MHKEFTEIKELITYLRDPKGGDIKGVCELGNIPAQLAERLELLVGISMHHYRITLDSYGLRHAFMGHSQEWGSRDHCSLLEADVLALPNWIFNPATLKIGVRRSDNQPLRLLLEHPSSQQLVKTVVILEVRPRHRRLVLVTMYKTQNG